MFDGGAADNGGEVDGCVGVEGGRIVLGGAEEDAHGEEGIEELEGVGVVGAVAAGVCSADGDARV